MNTNSQRSTERHFLQHSFSLLQRKSGQVVKTESWTASSFEVNKGQKLGSGGFSNVYRLRTLAHRLPSKNLPPRLRPRQVFSTTQLPYLTPHFLDANEWSSSEQGLLLLQTMYSKYLQVWEGLRHPNTLRTKFTSSIPMVTLTISSEFMGKSIRRPSLHFHGTDDRRKRARLYSW